VIIDESQRGGIQILQPRGRIDGATSPEFQAKVLEALSQVGAGVIVDFSGVDYISSAGFRVLMTAMRQKKEGRLAVAALQPVIQEIFSIARFQHVVPIFASVDDAVKSWDIPAA
jgi:anti-sigma B factor antagonist/stage II sporulation protein AA (anti-sigma F factor antagonist)